MQKREGPLALTAPGEHRPGATPRTSGAIPEQPAERGWAGGVVSIVEGTAGAPGCGTVGCSPGTFIATVNVNTGQSKSSPRVTAAWPQLWSGC